MTALITPETRKIIQDEIKRIGAKRLILIYLGAIIVITAIEFLASYNLYHIEEIDHKPLILRDIFSTIAILVVAFSVIASTIFLGGRTKTERQLHHYFRTLPLLIYTMTAVIGDVIAIFLAHNTGFFYVVFFTSLIALNIFAIMFAIYSVERTLHHQHKAATENRFLRR